MKKRLFVIISVMLLATALFFTACTEPPLPEPDPCEECGVFPCVCPPRPLCDLAAIMDTVLIPSHRTPAQMAEDIRSRYHSLRTRFLRSTADNQYSLFLAGGTGVAGGRALTNSETHGYGMLILALAAQMGAPVAIGDERAYFDRMNAIRKSQRSNRSHHRDWQTPNNLMSWVIHANLTRSEAESRSSSTHLPPDLEIFTQTEVRSCWSNDTSCWESGYGTIWIGGEATQAPARWGRSSSATDGDLDMAYALLMAYRVWGDRQHKDDAIALIESIKDLNFIPNLYRTNLGDWDLVAGRTRSRTSDWMPGHFWAFYQATGDPFWRTARDEVYALLAQAAHPATGLVPDFIVGQRGQVSPVRDCTEAGVEGEHNCENFAFNACRVPWRLAKDWVHNQRREAKYHINKISCWLRDKTGEAPANIGSGYFLDGVMYSPYNAMAFVAPFASGMLGDGDNQGFLNRTYSHILQRSGSSSFYNESLGLLNLFLITGNWPAAN